MSGEVQVELWMHEYKLKALSSVLADQGTSVEERTRKLLAGLYEELVPREVQEDIRTRVEAERAEELMELEAAKRYTVFRVTAGGTDQYFRLDQWVTFLEIGKVLRRHLEDESASGFAELKRAFPNITPISAEEYDQMLLSSIESGKVAIFEMDFDRLEVSAVSLEKDWQTYTMKDVSSAVYFACRKASLLPEQYEPRFENRLVGKAIPSAGHLSAREIFFADEISEMDERLNFYMDVSFDVDAVFGTRVCTSENDDTLNVYADYDMATGQVRDLLEVDLHWTDGREESLEYRLNAVEKWNLLRKMDDYCQRQTGQTLAEYSAQRMAEEMLPPVQPAM